MTVHGVDGWRRGWVAASITDAGVQLRSFHTFAALAADLDEGPLGVDIPIGLLDGPRRCDKATRAFLGKRGSSVFPAPTRQDLEAFRGGRAYGPGMNISAQAWNLLPKIAEVADFLASDQPRAVSEAHPEASFQAMNGGRAVAPKKTARGVGQRLAAIQQVGLAVDLVEAPPDVPIDDILDAVAVAWTMSRTDHRRFPADAAPGEPVIIV